MGNSKQNYIPDECIQRAMLPQHVLIVTGASGAGKSSTVRALDARRISGVECYEFDSIGVPAADVMEREFGGGEAWQAAMAARWLDRLGHLPATVRVAVLDGQMRPSFVFESAGRATPRAVGVVLMDCSPNVRASRLRIGRNRPDLATPRMDAWATYLLTEAEALNLPIINTTDLTIAEAARQLEAIVRRLLEHDAL